MTAVFIFVSIVLGLQVPAPAAVASETDALYDAVLLAPAELELDKNQRSRAEALTCFALGIFAEENNGPERAMDFYSRTLELDPGFLGLAISAAQEFLRRGDFPRAIAKIKDAAKARPGDALPELILAEIYLRHLSKPEIAEKHALRARRLAPELFACAEILWEIYTRQGLPKKAAAVLDAAAKSTSEDPAYWLQFAEFHRRFLEDTPANRIHHQRRKEALDKAVEKMRGSPAMLLRAADLYFLFRDFSRAAELYSLVYRQRPQTPLLREKLAAAHLESDSPQQAVPLLKELFAENPQDWALCDQLASLAADRGDAEEAILYRQKALALAPPDPARYQETVAGLLALHKYDLAIVYLRDAISLFPGSGVFPYILGAALARSGKPAEALPFFEQALAETSVSPHPFTGGEFYFEFGMAAEQAGEFARAAELLKLAVASGPPVAPRAANYLGYMWVERGENLEEAGRLIRLALESEPDNGAYMDSLGWWYYKTRNYPMALVTLLKSAELLDSPDPVVFDHIGDAYRALGRLPEALLYWQKALQLDPHNSSILEKIESLSASEASRN